MACGRSGESGGRDHASSAAVPTRSKSTSASSAAVPLGGAAHAGTQGCEHGPSEYWVRIEGEGAPYTLRAGAPRPPLPLRDCEPAAIETPDGVMISACASAADVRRSCWWSKAGHAVYYDRSGVFWELAAKRHTSQLVSGALDGSSTFVGHPRAREREIELTIVFHVGMNVASVPAPNVWGSGEFARF
jgi:hypothetical protein